MNKRGIELSFGMIFSIIIIIAIIAVSFYAINKFLGVKNCSEQALFLENFQNRIDSAWNSEIVKDVYVGRISDKIESVCVGDLSRSSNLKEYSELGRYGSAEGNLFFYPPNKVCEGFVVNEIEHLGFVDGLRCFPVVNGRVQIPIEKESTDALVMVPGA